MESSHTPTTSCYTKNGSKTDTKASLILPFPSSLGQCITLSRDLPCQAPILISAWNKNKGKYPILIEPGKLILIQFNHSTKRNQYDQGPGRL
ncbi:hypothetical protein BDE02_03G141500 [Populus trichocarpa]|nr:hypothetical protein BDE02_03G141500 [Populus trichocarpa]